MTSINSSRGSLVFNRFSGSQGKLIVCDPVGPDAACVSSFAPNHEFGSILSVKSLIRIVGNSARVTGKDDRVKHPTGIDSNPRQGGDDDLFYLLGEEHKVDLEIRLLAVNKPFRIAGVNCIFIGGLVFTVAKQKLTETQKQIISIGGLISDENNSVVGIVVRISGDRIFAAELDERFFKEWSFDTPSEFVMSDDLLNVLNDVRAEVQFKTESADV